MKAHMMLMSVTAEEIHGGGIGMINGNLRMNVKECPFCDLDSQFVMDKNEYAASFLDAYPVTEYHTLFVPRRHVLTYFDLTDEERESIHELITFQRKRILDQDPKVKGFNVGWNCGKEAGQTVFHAHCHLIARRGDNDLEGGSGFLDVTDKPLLHPWV